MLSQPVSLALIHASTDGISYLIALFILIIGSTWVHLIGLLLPLLSLNLLYSVIVFAVIVAIIVFGDGSCSGSKKSSVSKWIYPVEDCGNLGVKIVAEVVLVIVVVVLVAAFVVIMVFQDKY